jgi:cell filamentation protein
LTDPEDLQEAEERATRRRLTELAARPVVGHLDYDHMKEIHRRIFQDVYEWAGEPRVGPWDGPMSKHGPDVVNFVPGDPLAPVIPYDYYPARFMDGRAQELYAQLAAERRLAGLDISAFLDRFAWFWNEINTVHSFREGNTRSQFVFFSQLADQAGYRLETGQFAHDPAWRESFRNARFYGQHEGEGGWGRLRRVLADVVVPRQPG